MKRIIIFIFSILCLILIIGIGFFVIRNYNAEPSKDVSSERCNQNSAVYLNPQIPTEERVADLMSRMTEWEKIGQMVLVEKNSIHNINDITKYNLGALLSGGGAAPQKNTPLEWLKMVNIFQSAAKKTCLGIPLLYGIDAIHGNANVLGSTVFPHSIGLSATRDPDLVKRIAKATAEEMAATGIYWSFSPNLDVVKDIRWGKTYETFGSETANVAELGTAYLEGVQDGPNGYFNVLGTLKHFVGGGVMEYGTSRNKNFKIEEGNVTVDEKILRQEHIAPFQKAIEGGAQSIMASTGSWQGNLNTSNHYLLTDVLKKELGFSGFIVSDWYGVYEVSSSKYDSTVAAINAGVDVVMTPFEYKDFMSNMQKALSEGDITKERLDDAVKRILTVKFKTGLFDRPQANPEGLSVVGSSEHRSLAREAVRKSQVLLKNNKNVLPLSKSLGRIIVAGTAANNIGQQSGGWTVEWQGVNGNWIPGTTILQGIKNTVLSDSTVEYNQNGDFVGPMADIGIAVVGEKPYAEGKGDSINPSLSGEDLKVIAKVKKNSKKMVVIIISGRPLDIKKYIHGWDGVIAVWLPGSEGEGVSDVLFGDYPFSGNLPVEWPL